MADASRGKVHVTTKLLQHLADSISEPGELGQQLVKAKTHDTRLAQELTRAQPAPASFQAANDRMKKVQGWGKHENDIRSQLRKLDIQYKSAKTANNLKIKSLNIERDSLQVEVKKLKSEARKSEDESKQVLEEVIRLEDEIDDANDFIQSLLGDMSEEFTKTVGVVCKEKIGAEETIKKLQDMLNRQTNLVVKQTDKNRHPEKGMNQEQLDSLWLAFQKFFQILTGQL